MKVVRIQLYRKSTDNNNIEEINEILWALKNDVRGIANRAIQLSYKNMIFEQEYYKTKGKYPTKEELREYNGGKTLGGYIYSQVSNEFYKLNTGCISATLQNVTRKFSQEKIEYLKGTRSIPSYRRDMPIDIPKKNIVFDYEPKGTTAKWNVTLSLLSNKYKKEVGEKKGQILFDCVVKDRSTRTILERCYDGIYDITASKLIYKNGKWFLNLGYIEPASEHKNVFVKKENICACFIGEYNAIYASNNINETFLQIDGGEVEKYRLSVESKRRALLKSRTACGDASIGRGYHHRVKLIERYSEKISNFRDTTNHRYSRAIINYAKENRCGTIIIENLQGVSDRNKLLRNWSYFDLQSKIQYKAQSEGIDVLFIDGNKFRNICSCCGAILDKLDSYCSIINCKECGSSISYDKNMSANMIKEYENSSVENNKLMQII